MIFGDWPYTDEPGNLCSFSLLVYRKRQDGLIKDLDSKQNEHRDKLAKLQQQFQKTQAQTMAKS